MLSGFRRSIVKSSILFSSSTKKLYPESSNHEEIFFCHSLFSLHLFLGSPKESSKSSAKDSGRGRQRNQRPEKREAKERRKSKREDPNKTRRVFFSSSRNALLKLKAGSLRAKFGFSPGRQGGKDILSNAHPEAGRAKRAFRDQTMGLFEKKESAKEKDKNRDEEKKSLGGLNKAFLASPFPGNEEKSMAMEAQRAQREGRPKKERAKTSGRESNGSGGFFPSSSPFARVFTGPAVRLPWPS